MRSPTRHSVFVALKSKRETDQAKIEELLMSEGVDRIPDPGVPTSRYIAFTAIALAGAAIDLVSKEIVFSWPGSLTGEVMYWWWPGHAGIQTSLNEGALFGLGYGYVPLFVAISIAAAIAIPVWLFRGGVAHDWWITIALGAIMAGVLGNLYDRAGFSGVVWPDYDPRAGQTVYAVRDWILWQASDRWRWPNFNIADALLVTGAALLFLRTLLEGEQPQDREAPTA